MKMKKEEISESTKRRIADSLKKIMAKKSFDKITVREILEDADITRPTFYYHFEDVYDLMVWMFNTELLALLEKSENCITWDEGILLVLEYVEQNRAVCLCAYNSIGRDAMQRLFMENTKAIMQRFIDNIVADTPAKAEDVEFICEFYTIAFVGNLAQWLRFPQGRTPEDMIRLIDIAMNGNIKAAIERSAVQK